MIDDLKRMAVPMREIDEVIKKSRSDCGARLAYRRIVEIYDKVMSDGCKAIKGKDD